MSQTTADGFNVSSRTLSGIVGFGCFIAWFMLTFFGAARFDLALDSRSVPLVLCVGFVAIFLVSQIIKPHVRRIVGLAPKLGFPLGLAALASLLPLYMLVVPEHFIASFGPLPLCLLMVVAAIPAVMIPMLWENICDALESNTARVLGCSLFIGGALFLMATWLTAGRYSWLLAIVLVFASALTLFVVSREVAGAKGRNEDEKPAPDIDRRITHLSFSLNIGFGMAWPLAGETVPLMIAFSAVAVLAFSLFVNAPARLKDNTVVFMIRLCVTCLAVGLLVGQVIGGRVGAVCCFVVGAAWLISWSLLDGLLIRRARTSGVDPATYIAPIKISSNAGFACGWAFSTAVAMLKHGTALESWLIMGLALLVIVVCVCLLPFNSINRSERAETPIGTEKPLSTDEKMRRLTTIYSLTPREAEIVRYMAGGRNASAIAGKLVLSENTVRSHIYNIYNKIGVHSQQELIELVADSKFDPLSM